MTRTENIELLLRISESLDIKETDFKRRLYNYILVNLGLFNTIILTRNHYKHLAETITNRIGEHFLLNNGYHKIKSRKRKIVTPKYISIWFIIHNTKLSHDYIGKMFSFKDHSMISHAKKTIQNLMDVDRFFKEDIQVFGEKLNLRDGLNN